jgi:hypothetical protein
VFSDKTALAATALHDPSSIVKIAVPTILSLDLFDQVQRRLDQNSPRITAPRIGELKQRIQALKQEREVAQAVLDPMVKKLKRPRNQAFRRRR